MRVTTTGGQCAKTLVMDISFDIRGIDKPSGRTVFTAQTSDLQLPIILDQIGLIRVEARVKYSGDTAVSYSDWATSENYGLVDGIPRAWLLSSGELHLPQNYMIRMK